MQYLSADAWWVTVGTTADQQSNNDQTLDDIGWPDYYNFDLGSLGQQLNSGQAATG